MLVVTYSEARKTLASVLDRAKNEGAVIITRSDGSMFRLTPEKKETSPFNGICLDIHLAPGALSAALADARNESAERALRR